MRFSRGSRNLPGGRSASILAVRSGRQGRRRPAIRGLRAIRERRRRRSRHRRARRSRRRRRAPPPCRRRRRRCSSFPARVEFGDLLRDRERAAVERRRLERAERPVPDQRSRLVRAPPDARHGRGPISRIIAVGGTASIATVRAATPGAQLRGDDRVLGQDDAAVALRRPGRGLRARSRPCRARTASGRPAMPWAKSKVFAIAPPIASTSTLPIRKRSRSSLVETLAPPISAMTGRVGCSSAADSASSSACISLPAAAGSRCASAAIEACARCAAENASST